MADELSVTFSALSDPTRRAMLARLAEGPATVNELAAPFELSLPTVSRHLKVLEGAGLIYKQRSRQFRSCRLEPEPLAEIDRWLERYRELFEGSFDRLGEQLRDIMRARADVAKDAMQARSDAGDKEDE
ncbi:MAG: metalloregulator ArsR/SmtB family transcription factor [Devosia sp.]